MDLFHDFVDVDAVALFSLSLSLLVACSSGLRLSCFLGSFSTGCWRHDLVDFVTVLCEGMSATLRSVYL